MSQTIEVHVGKCLLLLFIVCLLTANEVKNPVYNYESNFLASPCFLAHLFAQTINPRLGQQDNGGVNDRHWVFPRSLMEVMLGAWATR